jgi:hypothetical protein
MTSHEPVAGMAILHCLLVLAWPTLRPGTLSHYLLVRFEVFTAVSMKNGVFWDVTPCGSCKYCHFGGT